MNMAQIISLIIKLSAINHLDVNTVLAVAQVESNFNVKAQSPGGDLGIFQLSPKAFPNYTKKQLLNPETNIRLGIAHIKEVKNRCEQFKEDSWIICYNLGSNGGQKIRHPTLYPYFKKIKKQLNEQIRIN